MTFNDDGEAIEFLKKAGYQLDNDFVFHPPVFGHVETPDETNAIDYLCLEWDYGFDKEPL